MMKGQALEINGQIGDDELALEIAEDSAVQFVVLTEALVVFELDSLIFDEHELRLSSSMFHLEEESNFKIKPSLFID